MLTNLFESNPEINPPFNFKKLLKDGYKITPKHAKRVIYPFLFLMLFFAGIGIFSFFSAIYHDTYNHPVYSTISLLLIGLVLLIYTGTAQHWLKIKLEQKFNQTFYLQNRETLKQNRIAYTAHANPNYRKIIKSFYRAERYFPFVQFIYSQKIDAYQFSVGSFIKTSRPRQNSPSGSQQKMAFILIKGLKQNHEFTRLSEQPKIEQWLKLNFNQSFSELIQSPIKLKINGTSCLLEFSADIQNPEKKLEVLAFFKSRL